MESKPSWNLSTFSSDADRSPALGHEETICSTCRDALTLEDGSYKPENRHFSRAADRGLPAAMHCLTFLSPSVYSICCCRLVAKSGLTLCNPVDCSLPGSSVHGIPQARILEWVAVSFSRRSSQSRDWTDISCIAGRIFTLSHRGAHLKICIP